ncbi:MAG: hypothetical protein J5685_00955, partial [Clostridiales bacterium]|nr:hypothetical protein [Clostridiales bacterium]
RASKKSGHYVSGIPLIGGILVALGFLLSPVKWLALLGLLEPSFAILMFRLVPDYVRYMKDLRKWTPPQEMEGGIVVEYSSYNKCYEELRRPLENDPEAFQVHTIIRYIIIKTETGYRLLGQEISKETIALYDHKTLFGCKVKASEKAKWIKPERT